MFLKVSNLTQGSRPHHVSVEEAKEVQRNMSGKISDLNKHLPVTEEGKIMTWKLEDIMNLVGT